jgi:hypothetical protein
MSDTQPEQGETGCAAGGCGTEDETRATWERGPTAARRDGAARHRQTSTNVSNFS